MQKKKFPENKNKLNEDQFGIVEILNFFGLQSQRKLSRCTMLRPELGLILCDLS